MFSWKTASLWVKNASEGPGLVEKFIDDVLDGFKHWIISQHKIWKILDQECLMFIK